MTSTVQAGGNFDPTRAWTRGLLGDSPGPAPFRCCRCEADSRYGRDGLWFCLAHWQQARETLFAGRLRADL